jgi:4-hydroxythreonine-4-phosphate dehydrogenase
VAPIALTSGEPAGIGPELVARLAADGAAGDVVAIADPALLRDAAASIGVTLETVPWQRGDAFTPARGRLRVLAVPLRAPAVPGRLDARNAAYVLDLLARAADGAAGGEFRAVVTAPVHKGILNDAGIAFTGHTEFFAGRAASDVVMMLVAARAGAPDLRVALATTHLALADVPRALTHDHLVRVLRILDDGLRERFGIAAPRIGVLGLNPHAGEGGHLGREELDVIAPVLEQLRGEGLELDGPLPADTAFAPQRLTRCDAVLAMYHDQGLPVLKYAGFGHAVNVTLGLPYVRTSVDHGTALDLAGAGRADPGSLVAAVKLAAELAASQD